MDKPITMVIKEFKEQTVKSIQNSHLPVWVLRDIFKDFTAQLEQLAVQEEQKAEQEYKEAQKNGD